jgi:hypothetical protein
VIYLVESPHERLRRGRDESVGVHAPNYNIFLHLLDLTEQELANAVPIPGSTTRVGSPEHGWWYVLGNAAKAYWPGIRNTQLKANGRPLHEVLAARR